MARGADAAATLAALLLLAGATSCAPPDRAEAESIAGDIRRVWSGDDPDFSTGDISPDGRLLSDINWASGDLQVVNVVSGERRDVTGQGYDAGRYAWTSAFSNDGKRLAVSWYREDSDSHELSVVNVDGSGARVLVPASRDHYYADPVDWMPNDDEVLVSVRGADRRWRFELVRVSDGARRVAHELQWQTPGGGHDQAYPEAEVAPDGRFIAYDYPPSETERTRDIYVVPTNGGVPRRVVSGPKSDRLLGWLPDGSGILFYSDRAGTPGVWRLDLRDGDAAGEPRLVRADLRGMIPIGFTRNAFAYGIAAEPEHVVVADMALAQGRGAGPPRPVETPIRRSLAADWSPDGRRIAYVVFEPWPDPVETLVIREVDGAVIRTVPFYTRLHASNGTLRWTSDSTIYVWGYQEGIAAIHRIDLRDGSYHRVPLPPGIGRGATKWFDAAPDATLYMVRGSGRPGISEIVAYAPGTGSLRVIGSANVITNSLAVSADGAHVAFLGADRTRRFVELRVLSTRAVGEARTVYRAPRGSLSAPVAFLPDGQRLLFEQRDAEGSSALWSVAIGGGAPARVLPQCCDENDVRIHPDGRRMTFAMGQMRGELWMLTGY